MEKFQKEKFEKASIEVDEETGKGAIIDNVAIASKNANKDGAEAVKDAAVPVLKLK